MPWWSWVLIWTGLVLVLLATLAILGVHLYRKAMALMAEVGRLSDLQAQLAEQADAVVKPYEPVPNAIVRGQAQVELERRGLRAIRYARSAQRREARIAHARELTTADPMQYADLVRKK